MVVFKLCIKDPQRQKKVYCNGNLETLKNKMKHIDKFAKGIMHNENLQKKIAKKLQNDNL